MVGHIDKKYNTNHSAAKLKTHKTHNLIWEKAMDEKFEDTNV
jgi:hypothetical protein